jgi:hypothetical protein
MRENYGFGLLKIKLSVNEGAIWGCSAQNLR